MKIQSSFYLGILFIISGCAGPYMKRSSKQGNMFKYITKFDTLKVSNSLVYSYVTRSAPFYPVTEQFVSKDSIMEKLLIAFSNNNIPVNNQTLIGVNYKDSMKLKRMIRFNNIDEVMIMRANKESGYLLFPVITFTNIVHFGGYMTSNSIAGSSGFTHNTYFDIMLYILKESSIVYKNHMMFVSNTKFVDSYEEGYQTPSGISIKQEHWDELVRRTMRGYFKQVGRNKGGLDSN
jgi:hypothetical protein